MTSEWKKQWLAWRRTRAARAEHKCKALGCNVWLEKDLYDGRMGEMFCVGCGAVEARCRCLPYWMR